jgi:hypothetical protein
MPAKKETTKKAPAKKTTAKPKVEAPKVPKKGEAYPGNKSIPELVEELQERFKAKMNESYRARQCARIVNKLKRLFAADEALKG